MGRRFFTLTFAPLRSFLQLPRFLAGILNDIGIYIVRRRAWGYLQELAFGLDGYVHKLPDVQKTLAIADKNVFRLEELPTSVTERALASRADWVRTHLGDVSETFSKMVVTAADLTYLLKIVETDLSLVHAAYYSDAECIERIADWIAESLSAAGQEDTPAGSELNQEAHI
jgi:hypothetical protein